MSLDSPVHDVGYVGEDDSEFFRAIHGRSLNALNSVYMLPVDQDEIKRSEFHHRMLQFVFHGKNYIGPVKRALQFGERRRVLDLGTGAGYWAIDIADEFPGAEVIGIDLAPIQPRSVPPNCTFELCDLDQSNIPYPDNHFDLVHARSMHTGIRDYPRFLQEIVRILRPGGVILLIEPNLTPVIATEGQTTDVSLPPDDTDFHGWFTLWNTYKGCLRLKGVDVTVPQQLSELLAMTQAFEDIVTHDGNVPVGFWPQGDAMILTVGQLQWLDYELLLPALKPLFLDCGIARSNVERIIDEAQRNLYRPPVPFSTLLHVIHATKRSHTISISGQHGGSPVLSN
ncbi:hypothetical protein AMATHDRAFT_135556 [Amanita thiersii Skay4041]|uniref:Methyltransferase domain-containing protein n=1 Tax=Amanita thiersii Skay4041 TaxID=703135 RepID=A0A2A9NZZ2_9AGAR|nr:hypothetical protein AMATHDRAFT_135556 [Amanita thiersii Skay4041]